MFFIMGINSGRKDLDFHQMTICDCCGQYGRYTVFMTYTVLSLFFIPVFKWNRQYFVRASCCGASYRLNFGVGRRIEHGENVEILPQDLEAMAGYNQRQGRFKRCTNCGYTTDEDFEFCPKCGRRF